MATIRKHPKRTRNLAFKLWRANGKNLTKVSRVLLAEHEIKVEPATLMRWRDMDMWDAKDALISNQVKRLMRNSDDPVLREMVLDDMMFMRFLGFMVRMIEEVLGRKASRKNFLPKNTREMMAIMEFVVSHQTRILAKDQQPANPQPTPGRIVYNDNRKVILRDQLAALPKGQSKTIIEEIRGAVDKTEMAKIRRQAWDEDEDEDESAVS